MDRVRSLLSLYSLGFLVLLAYIAFVEKSDAANERAMYAAVVMFVVGAVSWAVEEVFFSPSAKRRKARREERKQARAAAVRQACADADARIGKEWNNFTHIELGKGYSGPSHQDAIEIKSFELLAEDVAKLVPFREFSQRAKEVLAEADRINAQPRGLKNVDQLIPLLRRLRDGMKPYVP